MADFIKLQGLSQPLYYNRNLIVSFYYDKTLDSTTISFTGGSDDYITLPGDQTEQILHGEAVDV